MAGRLPRTTQHYSSGFSGSVAGTTPFHVSNNLAAQLLYTILLQEVCVYSVFLSTFYNAHDQQIRLERIYFFIKFLLESIMFCFHNYFLQKFVSSSEKNKCPKLLLSLKLATFCHTAMKGEKKKGYFCSSGFSCRPLKFSK